MKQALLFSISIGFGTQIFAQTTKPEIITDRPDQTEASAIVPKGGLQVELGTQIENDVVENVKVTNYTYTTALIKYGVNEHFELRLVSEFLGERTKYGESNVNKVTGISPLALGVKIKLADENRIWPQTSFMGHINLKSGSSEFAPDYTAADFRFTFDHTLSKKLFFSYNIGAEWNGKTPDATFLYTVVLCYLITDKLTTFVESYSFFPEETQADHRVDAGFMYKITPLLQWDISAGLGLNDAAPDSFISTGISFRLLK